MKRIAGSGLVLFLLLAVLQPVRAWPPERDVVAVEPAAAGDALPGQLTGDEVVQGLRDALGLVRGGEAAAARPGLEALGWRLRRLQKGREPGISLPDGYRSGGQLWLPVRVRWLRMWLDTPDLTARPGTQTGARAGDLPVRAQRIEWLPVMDTARRVGRALPLLNAGAPGRQRAARLLENALRGLSTRTVWPDRPLVAAYYRVEESLSAAPHWDAAVRARLRRVADALADAADALADAADGADLAERIRVQAQRLTPSVRELQDLARALRRRIVQASAPIAPGKARGAGS